MVKCLRPCRERNIRTGPILSWPVWSEFGRLADVCCPTFFKVKFRDSLRIELGISHYLIQLRQRGLPYPCSTCFHFVEGTTHSAISPDFDLSNFFSTLVKFAPQLHGLVGR